MKEFTRLFGRLPFSGKFRINRLLHKFYYSLTAQERRKHYRQLQLLLVSYVVLHTVLALSGVLMIAAALPSLTSTYLLVYSLANACAAICQAYLTRRALRFYTNPRSPYPRTAKPLPQPSRRDKVVSIAVTFTGQAVFFVMLMQLL